MSLFDAFRPQYAAAGGAPAGIYAPWLTYDAGAPDITPAAPPQVPADFSSAPVSLEMPKRPGLFSGWGDINPDTGLSKWDRLALVGAAMRDDPNTLPAMQTSVLERSKLALANQLARQKQTVMNGALQAISGVAPVVPQRQVRFNGQPVPVPTQEVPVTAPPAPMAGGVAAGAPISATGLPALPGARSSPLTPQMRQSLAVLAIANGEPQQAATILDDRKKITAGPDGWMYDQDTGEVLGRLPQHTVQNGFNVDLGAQNAPSFIPNLPQGTMPDGRGGVVNIPGLTAATAAQAGAVTGAQEAARAPYDFINAPTPNGAPRVMSKAAAVGGVFTGQTPTDAQRATANTNADLGLPQALQTGQQALDLIDKLKGHPALPQRTGVMAVLPSIPGTPGADFDAMAAQLQGKVFLQAYGDLKGAGQITEVEGRKATDAIARLNRSQSTDGYVSALNDLRDVIQSSMARAQAQAAKAPQAQPTAAGAMPARSAIEAEMRRRGLLK